MKALNMQKKFCQYSEKKDWRKPDNQKEDFLIMKRLNPSQPRGSLQKQQY
jgi:hypothetical protein